MYICHLYSYGHIWFQLKELKERQKQQLRHKALKKGLDPEALTGKYPVSHEWFYKFYVIYWLNFQPKIQVASKYERRVDTRSYVDKKKLFEGVSIDFSTFHQWKTKLNHQEKLNNMFYHTNSYFDTMPDLYL